MDALKIIGKPLKTAKKTMGSTPIAPLRSVSAPVHGDSTAKMSLSRPVAVERAPVRASVHVHWSDSKVQTFELRNDVSSLTKSMILCVYVSEVLGRRIDEDQSSWTVTLPFEKGAKTREPAEELVEGMTVAELLRAQGRLVGKSVHINIVARITRKPYTPAEEPSDRAFVYHGTALKPGNGPSRYIAPPDISNVIEAVNTSRHPILLHGQRAGGRSTTALFAAHALKKNTGAVLPTPSKITVLAVPSKITVLTVPSEITSAASVWQHLGCQVKGRVWHRRLADASPTCWEDVLEQIESLPSTEPIALIIDDFDMIDDARFASSQVRDAVRAEMKEFIAELHEHMPEQLACIIFVGTHNTRLQWQSSFAASNTIPVKDLTLHDIEDLVARFCEEYKDVSTGKARVVDRRVAETIFHDTRGRFVLVMWLLSCLHDCKELLDAPVVTLELWKRHVRYDELSNCTKSYNGSLRTCLYSLPSAAWSVLMGAMVPRRLVAITPSQIRWTETLVTLGFLESVAPVEGYPCFVLVSLAMSEFTLPLLCESPTCGHPTTQLRGPIPQSKRKTMDLIAVVNTVLQEMGRSFDVMPTAYAKTRSQLRVRLGNHMAFHQYLEPWLAFNGWRVKFEMRFVGRHYVTCFLITDAEGTQYVIELASVVLPGDAAKHFARVSRNRKLLKAKKAVLLVFASVDEVSHSSTQVHAHGWHSTADKRLKQVHVLHSDTLTESSAYLVNHRKHSIRKVPDPKVHS